MKKRARFVWQLYSTYLLIILACLGGATWHSSKFLNDFFIDKTTESMETQAEIIAAQILPHLNPLDGAAIDKICKNIGISTPTRITIIYPDGTVMGDSEKKPSLMDNHASRPEIKTAVSGKTGRSLRHSSTLNKQMIYVARPVYDAGRLRGVARASRPLGEIDKEVAAVRFDIAFGGLGIALLASLLCLYLSRRISRPLENMTDGAEQFAQGDLDYRMVGLGTRETETLAKSMNIMASRLKKRIRSEIAQRNEMEAILSSMGEGVIALDMDENVLSFNRAAARMFGGLDHHSKTRGIRDVIRNVDLWEFIEASKKNRRPGQSERGKDPASHPGVHETPESPMDDRRDIIARHNGERALNVQVSPMLNLKGEEIGSLLVADDVTQLRKLENARRDFVANVSHEIKTPLTAIKGFVETLQCGAKNNPEELERFLGIIETHANRLELIVEDLLQLARMETSQDKKEIQFIEESALKTVKSAIDASLPNALAKDIQIETVWESDFVIKQNAPLLEQALVNLIDNAIKYSDEKSRVAISVFKDGPDVNVCVKDHGLGIVKSEQTRIFERFYRVDHGRSRDQGGTGLGLAIAKHIVAAHGGAIRVESVRGKGSVFTISLPT